MEIGWIRVTNGLVTGVQRLGQDMAAVPNEPLAQTLEKIGAEGWLPIGELPPFTTEGEYKIGIERGRTQIRRAS
jgi:hypothetical protein